MLKVKDKPRVILSNKESNDLENIVIEQPRIHILLLIEYTGN